MKAILAVGAGGALGAMARYLVLILATRLFGLNFPYGTIIVNIAGSLMLGVLIEALALRWNVTAELRPLCYRLGGPFGWRSVLWDDRQPQCVHAQDVEERRTSDAQTKPEGG